MHPAAGDALAALHAWSKLDAAPEAGSRLLLLCQGFDTSLLERLVALALDVRRLLHIACAFAGDGSAVPRVQAQACCSTWWPWPWTCGATWVVKAVHAMLVLCPGDNTRDRVTI